MELLSVAQWSVYIVVHIKKIIKIFNKKCHYQDEKS